MTTTPQGSSFHTTRWSMVLEAGKADDRGQRALAELCGIYWYPLYAFLRRQGRDEHSAKDLTQGFFTRLIEKQDLQKVESGRGRFRSYLLASLKHFVANPLSGSRHNRGCAVDLTLYDLATGEQVTMPSGFDEFTERAYTDYPGGTSRQRWLRSLLRRVMEAEGFTVYENEWWHFDYRDWRAYAILNRSFDSLGSACSP